MLHCWLCREPFTSGYSARLRVNKIGEGSRASRNAATNRLVVNLCDKCGKAPGGRKTRPILWRALRDALAEAVAHIANVRDV